MDLDARTIRAYADHELTDARQEGVDQLVAIDETLRARVSFERSLRESAGRVMGDCAAQAPEEVVAAIRRQLAESTLTSACANAPCASDDRASRSEGEADGFDDASPSLIGRFFANPLRINYMALAACLAIMLSAVLVGVFGTPFHLGGGDSSTLQQLSATASFAIEEHARCSESEEYLAQKIQYIERGAIGRFLDARVGRDVPVFDLSAAGYSLLGAGACQTPPADEHAAHLIYRRAEDGATVSIFVQPDVGLLQIPPHRLQRETPACCILRDGEVVYTLVIPDERDRLFVEGLMKAQLSSSDK